MTLNLVDPKLASVRDKQSQRDLLDPSDPSPFVVDTSAGSPVRFGLLIENGPEGLIDLAVSSDEPWLQPEKDRLMLVGGESGDCILTAGPDGEGDCANLVLSWEGSESALCQTVMIMRKLSASPPPPGGKPDTEKGEKPPVPPPKSPSDAAKKLLKLIDGFGEPDSFIDIEEEYKVFRKGGDLELSPTEVESILNRRCSEKKWSRQRRLTEKLTVMLREATQDDGLVDKQEFDHIVNFAVGRKMPRKDVLEHCVDLMLDNNFRAKQGFLKNGPWFDKLRRQFGR
jgi:hypothetical protein